MVATEKLTLEVAVPQRLVVREDVDEVQVPASDGYVGILPDHAPMITELGIGVLSFKKDGKTRYMALNGGAMEVLPDHVRILADTAEWAEEIDVQRARQALHRANDLLQEHTMEIDVEEALAAIRRAEARLEAYHRANG